MDKPTVLIVETMTNLPSRADATIAKKLVTRKLTVRKMEAGKRSTVGRMVKMCTLRTAKSLFDNKRNGYAKSPKRKANLSWTTLERKNNNARGISIGTFEIDRGEKMEPALMRRTCLSKIECDSFIKWLLVIGEGFKSYSWSFMWVKASHCESLETIGMTAFGSEDMIESFRSDRCKW